MPEEVVIDGVRYAPVASADNGVVGVTFGPMIGIGITTRNRHNVLIDTFAHFSAHFPPNAKIVIVDDASDKPVALADFRFETNVGIARAKNKCLEMLDDCDHIFLFDDDAYPIADEWWRPYIESREPHLMRQFLDLAGPRKLNDVTELYRDNEHFALSGPRGVMLYFDRRILDIVGGYDPIYDKFGYEHGDLSNRIHHAGLTTWRYADVCGSDELIYSLDEHEAVDRSFSPAERAQYVKKNALIHNTRRDEGYRAYIEYRTERKIVMTSLFTNVQDPQRPRAPKLDFAAVTPLAKSLINQDVVLFTDSDYAVSQERFEVVHYEVKINLYFERWIAALHYLMDHPEVTWAWCVDATDVQLLRTPWPEMRPGVLYLGHEPKVVAEAWIVANHRSKKTVKFLTGEHARDPLLNAGVVGGDRATLIEFLQAVVSAYFDAEMRVFYKKDTNSVGVGDMPTINEIAYTQFAGRVEFGPRWVSVFKWEESKNTWSVWKHK